MKFRFVILTLPLILLPVMARGQAETEELISQCVLSAGENITYLKDFLVQLPKATPDATEPVYKANMYLMKNMKYRFSVCDAPGSTGELVITIYDQNKELISSLDKNSGKKYTSIDFICNKTGLYTLWYNFHDGMQGSGVGVVCLIK